jgi:abhydrolase domain-containing protein 6
MKKFLGYGLLAVVAVLVGIYFLFPETLFRLSVDAQRHSAGLVKKEVQVDDHKIVYLEGGTGEAIVLLHGFGGNKDLWTPFAKALTPAHHVIIPDLPGFGESSFVAGDSYDLESQAKRLDRFAEALKLEKYHLAGNSMGGAIAAVYAARYPPKTLTLALMDTAGAKSAKAKEAAKELFKDGNPLLVGTAAGFDRLLQLAFARPPYIPGAFKKIMAREAIARRDENAKIWGDLKWNEPAAFENMLDPYLPLIQAPVFILWGEKDRLIDVSGVPYLEKHLKHFQTVVMKDAGHMPMTEKPREASALYLSFLKGKR